jgi:hypothetical protein
MSKKDADPQADSTLKLAVKPKKTSAKVKPAASAKPEPAKVPREKAPARKRSAVPSVSPALTDLLTKNVDPIYQIYFDPSHTAKLDPSFIPFSNAGNTDALREFSVFEQLAQQAGPQKARLWGAVSWRFEAKTGLTGAAFRQAIEEKPGFDLYYCNPFPEHEALFANGWQQGITAHPAFSELCSAVLTAAGLSTQDLKAIQPSQAFSACNYFVGSPAFWALYLPWVRKLIDQARQKLPKPVLSVLDSRLSDPRNVHASSTYWPFIVERLLPLFLRTAGASFKTHKLILPQSEARLNSHLLRLREMKDVAHRTRSTWLFACWLNYRNLYLLQTAGRDWCKNYLPLISPADLEFM